MLDVWLSGIEGLFASPGIAVPRARRGDRPDLPARMPGLGGATALALLMPLTYGLEPFTALALAGGVMGAVPMGGRSRPFC